MGKKLPEAQLKTGDAGAVGVASRTRSRGRRVDPRPKLPSSPKSDQELGLPRRGRAKQFDTNGNPVEALTCHQCKRNDKGRVVRCTKCKTKRFCIPCITTWYPQLTEDSIAEACPLCLGNCNCKSCIRLDGTLKEKLETQLNYSDDEKLQHSLHILQLLLPFMKQLNHDQAMEKMMEAKHQGVSLSELKVRKAHLDNDERAYCNNCRTSIFDYHRSCPNCSYDLCLVCCGEIREGSLQGGEKEVIVEYKDKPFDLNYLHGKKFLKQLPKREADISLSPENKVKSGPVWKASEDGTISCPPELHGGCGDGLLELRCMFLDNWISQLVDKAEELMKSFDFIESFS